MANSECSSWVPGPDQLELNDGEIHIWRAHLNCVKFVLSQLEATLGPDERIRADRFHFERDRNAFVAARGILRQLLGRYLGRLPADIQFDYGPQGKPSLRLQSKPSIQFNLSHSHGLALLAFATNCPLGVDVELVRSDFATDDIARRFFSPLEVEEWHVLPDSLRVEGFFLCWTRKEAYVKAKGQGLQIPLDSFHVSLTPGQPEELRSEDGLQWSLHSLRPGPGYVGALVGKCAGPRLRCWDWNPGPAAARVQGCHSYGPIS